MARLFIFAEDAIGTTIYHHAKLYKRGHVVDVLPDGQHGGTSVEDHPMFVIVSVPGAAPNEFSHLLAWEPSHDHRAAPSSHLGNTYQRRALKLDMAQVKAVMTVEEVTAATVKVAPIADPNVIGDPGSVIG